MKRFQRWSRRPASFAVVVLAAAAITLSAWQLGYIGDMLNPDAASAAITGYE